MAKHTLYYYIFANAIGYVLSKISECSAYSIMYRVFILVQAQILECVSSGTIRKFEWILRQFKEETRRLSSAKSSFVTQKWRKIRRNCVLRNF